MTRERFYFRLGVFTLAALGLVFAAVVFLGGGRFFRQTVTVETYFDESVSGLEVGAPVRHRGVDVGHVTKIGFVSSKYQIPMATTTESKQKYSLANLILVEMSIDREAVRPLDSPDKDMKESVAQMVKDGLRVHMSASLLGGGGYLDADFVDPRRKSREVTITWVPQDIYIPSEPSATSRLFETLDQVALEIQEAHPGTLITHLDELVTDANRLTAGLDTKQIQTMAVGLLGQVNKAVDDLRKILEDPQIKEILAHTNAVAANAHTLTDPKNSDVAALLGNLRKSSEELQKILSDPALHEVLGNTQALSANARKVTARLAELLASQQEDLSEIIRSLRVTMKNVEETTADAKENPARLLFGQPPPRVPRAGEKAK